MDFKKRLIALAFFLALSASAQIGGMKIPLRDYLRQIESEKSVNIGFIDEAIADIMVDTVQGDLQTIVSALEKQTGLSFEFISDTYLVVGDSVGKNPVCFLVLDADSGLPIPSATIQLPQQNLQTDENGNFCIPEFTGFAVTHIGYETLLIRSNPRNKTIAMRKTSEMLQETQIAHFLTRGIKNRTDGSYHIKSKNTGLLPGLTEPDVFQTLQQFPGAVSFDETISNLSIRGGTHDQNLFLWNGMRLFQTGHFFGLISALNPNLSHSVTLYKNATPAQMGDAVSGTVVIETLPETGSYFENSIGANMLNMDFNTAFKTSDRTSWQFSGRRSTTDFFDSPTYQSYFKRIFQNTKVTNLFLDREVDYKSSEKFYFYDFTGQFRQKIGNRSELQINSIFIENELEVFQRLTGNNATDDEESELKQQSLAANAILRTNWNARHHTSFSIFATRYRVDSEDRSIEVGNRILNQRNVIIEKGITARHTFTLSENLKLKTGYHLSETSVVDESSDSFAQDEESSRFVTAHALFVQSEWKWKRWFVFGGLRQNFYQTLNRYRTEPRLVATYDAGKGVHISLLTEMKSQTVQQTVDLQQDFFGLEKKRWTVADNQAKPLITSRQASLAILYRKNRWLLSAEPFAKRVSDISSRSQGFQNQFEFAQAIGNYSVYGAEFLVQKQWRSLTTWLNYQYNRNEYDFKSFSPSVFPNVYSIPNALRAGAVYDELKWQFALGANWFSGKYYTETASPIPVFDDNQNLAIAYKSPNNAKLDDYFQVNASAGFTQPLSAKANLKMGISIQNVLDGQTSINRSYRINSVDATIQQVNISSLGRTFNAFVRIFF